MASGLGTATTDTTPVATGGTTRHRAPAPYSDTFVAPDLRRRQRARRAAVLLITGGL